VSVVARCRRGSERASSAFRGRVDARVVTFHFKFKPTFQIDARVCVYDGREGDAWRVCVRVTTYRVRLTRHVAWFGRF
jgi:hypothetical protein